MRVSADLRPGGHLSESLAFECCELGFYLFKKELMFIFGKEL
jgi:hypothetical protein